MAKLIHSLKYIASGSPTKARCQGPLPGTAGSSGALETGGLGNLKMCSNVFEERFDLDFSCFTSCCLLFFCSHFVFALVFRPAASVVF